MSLQKDLAVVDLPSHVVALDKAIKAEWAREQLKKEHKPGKKKRQNQSSGDGTHKDKKERAFLNNNFKCEARCPKCKRKHDKKYCPMITGSCFHCKEKGHKTTNCLKKSYI